MFKRTLVLLLGAALTIAALAAAPSAYAAPDCGDPPETVGNQIIGTPCADTIRMPRGVTAAFGEGGDDTIYGQRGNDSLFGGEGADRLYGGVGDDRLRGGVGDDRLSGGFGADSLDGEAGNDFARGDATIDSIGDSGGGSDTLSFATGVTPGFPNTGKFFDDAGFPPGALGRGVYVDLGSDFANDGQAPSGGGVDEPLEPETTFGNFETVIGTPFDDYIVGTGDPETFYGGGGADLIDGNGGGDVAYGGAEGDGCVETTTNVECEFTSAKVQPRDPATISVGVMAPQSSTGPSLYLVGSDGDDIVTASYSPGLVTFTITGQSPQSFTVAEAPDSILAAGLAGNDTLSAAGFPETTSVILLGGEGNDGITGGATEDAVVDGDGNDTVSAAAGDDAVPNNGGADALAAGPGEDLFISNAVCDGDSLDGGTERDNANWANFLSPVAIDMAAQRAGLVGGGGQPSCPTGSLTSLTAIEDTEGSNLGDFMVGDPGPNQLLGRRGGDTYHAGAGDDSILANSGTPVDDPDPTIDCGAGFDTAQIDRPENGPDATPTECEVVEERNPNSFRPPDTPPDPAPETPAPETPGPETPAPQEPPIEPQPQPKTRRPPDTQDRTPPQTRIAAGPRRLLPAGPNGRRRVAFRFSATEPGSSFLCRLDRRRAVRCASPRAFFVGPGRHTFRVSAIDQAGNADPSPAILRFRVLR